MKAREEIRGKASVLIIEITEQEARLLRETLSGFAGVFDKADPADELLQHIHFFLSA